MLDPSAIFDMAPLRLVSRASQLAMAQGESLRGLNTDRGYGTTVTASGDLILDRSLVDAGGKGLFIKELERVLLCGEADLAVHSMKDMEAHFAPHTEIGAVLAREDRRDALVGAYSSLINCRRRLCWHGVGTAGGNSAKSSPRSADQIDPRQC